MFRPCPEDLILKRGNAASGVQVENVDDETTEEAPAPAGEDPQADATVAATAAERDVATAAVAAPAAKIEIEAKAETANLKAVHCRLQRTTIQ